ncbi:MAG: serine/threonine protein kinase [Myxococcaceae bacterium]|nr:serine/threonine protein kinase [Myxococcaceae bacterium]
MQGTLCPSCGALAPPKSTECAECGTSLSAPHERTHVRARIDDAGRTLDDGSDDDSHAIQTDKRLALEVSTPVGGNLASGVTTRPSVIAVKKSTVLDSTIPFTGGGLDFEHDALGSKDTGPELDGVPQPDLPPPPVPSPQPSGVSMPKARPSARPAAATERAPAVRVDSPTPPSLDEGGRAAIETAPMVASAKKDGLIGTRLGEYVVEERVGIGGMGIVYRAVQPLIGNSVAIKVLRPDIIADENDLQRFLGEARTVNSIRHRSIISIFGAADTPDGRKYLVMEYLEGESLEARLQREGRLLAADALPILEDVLSALAAAHTANVVHRDLKPANVFLVHQSDGRPWVKLLDFGLARGANKQDVSRIAGTPDYISPEHARGKPAGPPSDLYAFGVLAFHLLTGRLPFLGTTPMEVMEQHVHKAPPVPHEVDDTIPLAMSHLITRLLEKEPANRPDAKTVKADLKAAAKELRTAVTHVGPRPSAPQNVPSDTILRGPPTPIYEAPRPDPKLERRAVEADRAKGGSWLGRNWPWLLGGVALLWILLVAGYLLTRPGVKPDLLPKPIQPPPESIGAPPEAPAPAAPSPPEMPVPEDEVAAPDEPIKPDPRKPPKKNPRGK